MPRMKYHISAPLRRGNSPAERAARRKAELPVIREMQDRLMARLGWKEN